LLLLGFLCQLVGAQMSPPDDITHDNPIPPTPSPLQLPDILGSGNNYTAYLPEGGPLLRLKNQGELPTTILAIAISADGDRQARTVDLGPGESHILDTAPFLAVGPVHLISLQDFEATALEPLRLLGRETAIVPVLAPRTRLKLVEVETPDGHVRTVGVDWDDRVHFPVFNPGSPFGTWDEAGRTVFLKDGAGLPVLETR